MSLFPQTADEVAQELFDESHKAKNGLGSSEKYDNGYSDAMWSAGNKVKTFGETLRQKRVHPRDLAVEIVDLMEGYTVEFAADPAYHRHQYDAVEELLKERLP